ncbi:response regulator transcription factor [Jannaschia sp. R86511]|uniref:response regulator transcription factor n=1 Tax=Jannaschia sp. R86511 TaxID=3093853 RepID=UPI0036D3554F
MARLLVVDDDRTVAEVVSRYLLRAGHEVSVAHDGPSALVLAAPDPPGRPADLVVLDVMLPGLDGIEVCRRLRQVSDVPVIMLTALGAEVDRVLGLEVGADDYVTKPFSNRELVLRVASVLRRRAAGARPTDEPADGQEARLRSGTLVVDPVARTVTRDGAPVSLTLRELDLLLHLLRHPGRAFSRDDLLSQVWGWDFGDHSTVTVHVRRLRHKIEADPARPELLATVWGIGYRWDGRVSGGTASAAPSPAPSPAPAPGGAA